MIERLGAPGGGRRRARAGAGLPPPLMTFKSFMLTMPDDLDPNRFQSLYEETRAVFDRLQQRLLPH